MLQQLENVVGNVVHVGCATGYPAGHSVEHSHAALLKDICVNDRITYKNFCRMDTVDYDELPSLVEASITTQDM